uniref:Uncharacterized protein n=1 Tax=Cryptomonas curvata TaxID=233186 RepID=A0A7S0QFC2_9CRYP
MGLLVHGDRLFSASHYCMIQEWALGTWAALRTVQACAGKPWHPPVCMVVSGSQLVCGLLLDSSQSQTGVRVWGLENLDLQHTLLQPSGEYVSALLAVDGGVWAGLECDVVVWGRGA